MSVSSVCVVLFVVCKSSISFIFLLNLQNAQGIARRLGGLRYHHADRRGSHLTLTFGIDILVDSIIAGMATSISLSRCHRLPTWSFKSRTFSRSTKHIPNIICVIMILDIYSILIYHHYATILLQSGKKLSTMMTRTPTPWWFAKLIFRRESLRPGTMSESQKTAAYFLESSRIPLELHYSGFRGLQKDLSRELQNILKQIELIVNSSDGTEVEGAHW